MSLEKKDGCLNDSKFASIPKSLISYVFSFLGVRDFINLQCSLLFRNISFLATSSPRDISLGTNPINSEGKWPLSLLRLRPESLCLSTIMVFDLADQDKFFSQEQILLLSPMTSLCKLEIPMNNSFRDLSIFASFVNLTSLELNNFSDGKIDLTASDCKQLSLLTNLVELIVPFFSVDILPILDFIPRSLRLLQLSISHEVTVNSLGFDMLLTRSSLTCLHLWNSSLTFNDLKNFSLALPLLRKLELGQVILGDTDEKKSETIVPFKFLFDLRLNYFPESKVIIALANICVNVELLTLRDKKFNSLEPHVRTFKNLHTLQLNNSNLDNTDLANLCNKITTSSSSLTGISIGVNKNITSVIMLRALSSLTSLSLPMTGIEDIFQLPSLPNLISLDLRGLQITNLTTLSVFGALYPSLRTLQLPYLDAKIVSLRKLETLTGLTKLNCSNVKNIETKDIYDLYLDVLNLRSLIVPLSCVIPHDLNLELKKRLSRYININISNHPYKDSEIIK